VTDIENGKVTNIILPKSWRLVRLSDLTEEALPGFAQGGRDSDGIIQLRMNNVDTCGHLVWNQCIRVPIGKDTVAKYQLLPGDVMFNNTNSTELVGKSALFKGYLEPVVYSNHFTRIRPRKAVLDSGYLAFWLMTLWQKKIFENLCNRWIGQSAFKSSKLLELEIPLPPLTEQERIVSILNEQMAAVEKARLAAEARLAAARAFSAAYLNAVFHSDQARRWPTKNLNEICRDITDGTHVTPEYVANGVPFLSVKDIREDAISFDNCRYITREQYEAFCKRCKCERGDILYTKVGTTGIAKAVDTDREFSIFVSVALLKLNEDINPSYIAIALNSPFGRSQAANLTQGMANRNLVIQDIKRIVIPLPSFAEQSVIVSMFNQQFNAFQRMVNPLTEELGNINALPAALLRQAFTGGI